MTVRTTSKTVTFTHPFNLSGMDKAQPAGTYTVETDEELLQTLSLPAYRRDLNVGSRSKWSAVPMARTSAEAAQSPAHGQARRLYRNPHCGGSFGPREARVDRSGQLTKNFLEFKGGPFGKVDFLPFAPRRDPGR